MTTGSARRPRDGPIVNRWALLAIPPIAFLVAFFLVPLVVVSLRSVTDFPKPTGDAFANYGRFFASAANIRVLSNTFWVAGLFPFWSSLLVRTYAWEVILRDTGIINSFLLGARIIDEPIPLIRTTLGVMLGMSQILLPFMVLPIYTVMRRIDPEYTKAAANLGAPPLSAFL